MTVIDGKKRKERGRKEERRRREEGVEATEFKAG